MSEPRLSEPAARTMLGLGQLDDVGAAVIALTREFWVAIDRMTMLEALLARHGIAIEELDTAQPDAATAALLDARRTRLLDAVLDALRGGRPDGEQD